MAWIIGLAPAVAILALLAGLALYALPATRSLPAGSRAGVPALGLAEAAQHLRETCQTGSALVEAARALVAGRMQYCRRNSFDSPDRAFRRGYGYCTQQAYALAALLARLGIETRAVYAFRNRFRDGTVGGHTWVRVTMDGEERDIDTLFYDARKGVATFTPLSAVRSHTPLFRWVTCVGEAAVNARRYYVTGKDRDW